MGHLKEHGQHAGRATQWVDPLLLHQTHLFLAHLLVVVGKAFPKLVEFGLDLTHGLRTLLHADLSLAGDGMEAGTNHEHQDDDRDTPVEDHRIDGRQEHDHEVGQPRERAEGAASAHQVEDEPAHAECVVGLFVVQDAPFERAGEDTHVPGCGLTRTHELFRAVERGGDDLLFLAFLVEGLAESGLDELDDRKTSGGLIGWVVDRMDAEPEVPVGGAEPGQSKILFDRLFRRPHPIVLGRTR